MRIIMWLFSSSGSKKTEEGTTVMTKKSQIIYKSGDVSSLILPGSQAFTPKAQGTTMHLQIKTIWRMLMFHVDFTKLT